MCSTRLLLWKNQKNLTRYPMTLYKWDSTAAFEYSILFGQAISQNSSKTLIVKGSQLLRMSNHYCFCRCAQGQLSQCNRRNPVLRAVVNSYGGLKGTKVFTFEWSVRNLKTLSKITGRNLCWSSFIIKLQPGIAYKKKPR